MIWQNPWAWIGLTAIALPILVHLLGRRRPKPLRFPTLRFLDASRIVPARRHRLNDIPLLLVRIGILIAAVAALAQPLVTSIARQRAQSATARVVIVDTSASMERQTPAGRKAADVARDLAQSSTTDATLARVIEAPALAPAITTAVVWLAAQSARRELVVVSDFQVGALDRADLGTVPNDVGISLRAIDVNAGDTASLPAESWGDTGMRADVRLSREATDVVWQPASTRSDVPSYLQLIARPDDREQLDAAVAAARLEGTPSAPEGHPVALTFQGAAERETIAGRVRALDRPWMFAIVDAIRRDPTIDALARNQIARSDEATSPIARATPIVANDRSQPFAYAAAEGTGAGERLIIFAAAHPGEALSAALIRRTWREAASGGPVVRESEPTRIDDAALRSWERAPGTTSAPAVSGEGRSDGRWFWALALLLLGLETWMRRTPPRPAPMTTKEDVHARVA